MASPVPKVPGVDQRGRGRRALAIPPPRPKAYSPIHPSQNNQGYELAKRAALTFLDGFKEAVDVSDREALRCVARSALRTKLREDLADQLTDIVTDAVCIVRPADGAPIDLHMVEIMHMRHRLDTDTRLVRGLVLDHGSRHPDMPRSVERAFILNANISLEYEKSEVNAGFFYSSAEQREKLVAAERAVTDAKVQRIIDLKNKASVWRRGGSIGGGGGSTRLLQAMHSRCA